jgi:DNA helicase-2/ATP-dependent DNA helicase PcrA
MALVTSEDAYDADQSKLTLMTLHTAKGLEFPVVFMIGMEDNLLPHVRSQDGEETIEEERRLCYVGMTRAKKSLYFFSARVRRHFGREEPQRPSRFIHEIPDELLEKKNEPEVIGLDRSYDQSYDQISCEEWGAQAEGITPGKWVRHPTLGVGIVRKAEPTSDGGRVWVDFQTEGLKKLALRYARLEPVAPPRQRA